MKAVLGLVSAAAVALVALIGHWETDPRPARPPVAATPVDPGGGSAPWLLIVLVVIAAFAGVLAVVAWRRRHAIRDSRFAEPAAASATTSAAADTAGMHRRWHCILTVNGMTVRRDYVDWPAADHAAMAREIEERFTAAYGADLPPGARVHARVTPVHAAQ